MTKYLSFPGLGIGPFHINDTAFTVFGLDVKWYGIIITVGMIIAFFYARSKARYEGITDDDIYDVAIFCVIFGIIGARLYYVLFKLDDFIVTGGSAWSNIKGTLLAIINIRSGGLAIFGGLIAGLITALVCARIKKIRIPVLLDVATPAAMLGQIIGRWGNFVNIEAYGRETSAVWRMGIHSTAGSKGEWISETFVHPTFLYESLWNLVGFIIISAFYKKKKYNGQVVLFYGMWYGLGRAFIEGLRTDSLMLGSVRISQIVAAAVFVICTVLFILLWVKTPESLRPVPEKFDEDEVGAAGTAPADEITGAKDAAGHTPDSANNDESGRDITDEPSPDGTDDKSDEKTDEKMEESDNNGKTD